MRWSAVWLCTGVCLLWLAGCAASRVLAPGEYRISGSLEGVGGGTLSEAGVLLTEWGEPVSKPLLRVPTAADGRFSLVAPGPGDYTLWLTAPGYPAQALYLQVLADSPDLRVTARLEPYDYRLPLEAPSVIGSWTGAEWKAAEALQSQPDGTWVLDRAVEGASVTYQFMGVTPEDHGVSCYPAEGYAPDTQGTFWCRATPRAGRVHILLDPRQLPRAATRMPLRATFAGAYAFLDSINALHARTRFLRELGLRDWKKTPEKDLARSFDYGTLPQELLAVALDARQPLPSRQLAVLNVLRLPPFYSLAQAYPGTQGEALATEFLQVLPLDSPRWAIAPRGLTELRSLVSPAGRSALAVALAERNPHPSIQAQGLAFLLEDADAAKDLARKTEIAQRLEPYAKTEAVAFSALRMHMPDSDTVEWEGKPAPDFAAPLLGSREQVSRDGMKGRFYLLDFWATWCRPCVGEMPFLHAAAEKFTGRGGFTLVSVSMDAQVERVTDFRAARWKMPWMHVFNGFDFATPIAEAFGVEGLPMTLLVDPQGLVVAQGEALRGEQLEKTLEALLPARAP